MNFSKAFDSIPHKHLFRQLFISGFHGKLVMRLNTWNETRKVKTFWFDKDWKKGSTKLQFKSLCRLRMSGQQPYILPLSEQVAANAALSLVQNRCEHSDSQRPRSVYIGALRAVYTAAVATVYSTLDQYRTLCQFVMIE